MYFRCNELNCENVTSNASGTCAECSYAVKHKAGDVHPLTWAEEEVKTKLPGISNSPQDLVNHPNHYKSPTGLESIDVIEAFGLGFNLGNVVKYILRAGKKTESPITDLKKARWYLDREIAKAKD